MKELLKWAVAGGSGALYAAFAALTAHFATGPEGVDPAVAGIAVFVIGRGLGWLASKVKLQPAA